MAASFQHYALPDEVLTILRAVVEAHGLVVIPEEPILAEPRIDTFTAITPEVEAKLASFRVLQLEGPFTKFPLEFTRRDSGTAAGTYFVSTDVGPRVRWVLPASTRDTPPELTPGSLSILKHYLDAETKQYVTPSPELEAAFKAIVATLKKHMTKVTVGKGDAVWIGREAKQKIDAGEVALVR